MKNAKNVFSVTSRLPDGRSESKYNRKIPYSVPELPRNARDAKTDEKQRKMRKTTF